MDTNYIIETKNLTKQYGSQKSVADLNIHVKRGRIYGLLGRNGAGKTTTMKMLLGLTKPTSGEVKIWGKSLQGNEKKLLPRIGSLIESPGFYPNLTGTENLRIFATLRGVPNNHAIKDALDLVGLPYKDKKLFSQYSLGMKQRLAIALAVMHDPELLILDEPITGLDPAAAQDLYKTLAYLNQKEGMAIVMVTHDLKAALKNGERGQTPFPPAVGILIQINARLNQIKRDGFANVQAQIRAIAKDFRSRIGKYPFHIVSDSLSYAVTPLSPNNPEVSAHQLFLTLKDEYGIIICPNGGELADKVFRVGHIGHLTVEDNDALFRAFDDLMARGILKA